MDLFEKHFCLLKDCSSIALEESPEASVISSPTTGLRHVPPVRTKVVRVNRRRSFAKKNRVPIGMSSEGSQPTPKFPATRLLEGFVFVPTPKFPATRLLEGFVFVVEMLSGVH